MKLSHSHEHKCTLNLPYALKSISYTLKQLRTRKIKKEIKHKLYLRIDTMRSIDNATQYMTNDLRKQFKLEPRAT